MNEKISILLATRNRSRLLRRALISLQHQTYLNIEILVLDDGSTDNTPALLSHFAENDSRIRFFRHDRSRGLACALNRLIAESKGVWIARMDDDDFSYPDRLVRQIEWMKAHKADVCGTWYRRISPLGRSLMRPPIDHESIAAELLFQPPLLHPSVVMRKEIIERYGSYREDQPYAEDYELWTRLIYHCRFGNVPQVLFDYMLSPRQVSHAYHQEQLESATMIRLAYLASTGIPHTAEQREIHRRIRWPQPLSNLNELEEYGAWLDYLQQFFSPNVKKVFSRQWLLCAVRGAHLGLKAYRM